MVTNARRMLAKVANFEKFGFRFDNGFYLKVYRAFSKNLFFAYPEIIEFHETTFQ